MKIVVFGANGNIGKRIVSIALARGHEVRAFVRDEQTVEVGNAKLEPFEGDVYKPEAVAAAVKDQDAVISALGSKTISDPMVCRDGMRAILPTMKEFAVSRLIVTSAFGAAEDKDFSLYTRMLRTAIPLPMRDKDEMEALIKATKLDWTIVRPAAFVDIWPKKSYRAAEVLASPCPAITRDAVAQCMVDQLEDTANIQKAIAIEGV